MPRRFDVLLVTAALLAVGLGACAPDAPDSARADPGEVGEAATAVSNPRVGTSDSIAGRPRVVFLGTSLTAGLGLRLPSERWPERLGRLADSAGVPIEVVNAGRSGDTSAGGLARLDWVLRDPLDVLVIELGANDGLRGRSTVELAGNLRTIIDHTRAAWPDAALLLVGMEAPTNMGVEYTDRFREVFPSVAEAEAVSLVPFLLDGVAGVPALNQADRLHPTAEGHAHIAHTVWPYLEPLVRRAAEVTP